MVSEQAPDQVSVISRAKLETSGFVKSVNEEGKIIYTRERKVEELSVPNPPTHSVMRVTNNGDGTATVVQFFRLDGAAAESWHFSQTEPEAYHAKLVD